MISEECMEVDQPEEEEGVEPELKPELFPGIYY